LYGTDKDIFIEPNQVVLTETTALKYFNRLDVIGEIVKLNFSEGFILLNIVGVIADSAANTHLKFDMLLSYPTMIGDPVMRGEYGETKQENWSGNNTYTYVLLAPNTNYDSFTKSLINFNQQLIEEKKIKNERIIGQKIGDIHLYSNKPFEPEPNGNASSVYFLLGVAFLVIISAFVNYINLATSKALDRAKEVGIRKVVGSTKNQLRIQFLFESFLINFIAGIFAVLLVAILRSKFIEVAGLPEDFAIFKDLFFWVILTSFIFIGILLSGLYPAFVLSSFKPSVVLKGSFSHSSQGVLLRKALVVFQFAITIVLLIQIFTVNEQLDYMRNMDLGVHTDHTIVINAPTQNTARKNYSVFKQSLLANPNIESVSVSMTVPGEMANEMSTTTGINLSEKITDHHYNFYITDIDADFIPLMGMELLAGNNFNKKSHIDKKDLIVNEEAIRLWGIPEAEKAIGRKLSFWGSEWTIIGVLKNYHQESAKSPYVPMLHMYSTYFGSLASIKFNNDDPKKQVAQIKEIYNSVFPSATFTYFFMDDAFNNQFKAEQRFQSVFGVLTGFSILIACLGLFGLASFTVSKRKKEIGVRKVLGASSMKIVILLTYNFVKTVFISVMISVPITYLLVQRWLENFAFRIELNWWLFLIPILSVFVLVILSVSIKTIHSALANPVESLRSD
jgi:putative ABC transport system permease protein